MDQGKSIKVRIRDTKDFPFYLIFMLLQFVDVIQALANYEKRSPLLENGGQPHICFWQPCWPESAFLRRADGGAGHGGRTLNTGTVDSMGRICLW
jgi:hypothetical protein